MFGYNYRYEMNASKNVIKLAPTKGTYAKAMLPSLLLWVGLGAMLAAANRSLPADPDPMLNPDEE